MKKLVYAMLALSLVAFVGCKKDKDKQKEVTVENLVGTWEIYKTYDDGEWDTEWGVAVGYQSILKINANGTGTMETIEEEYRNTTSFTYKMASSGTITITTSYGDTRQVKVKSLTDKELVLEYSEYGATYAEYYKRK
ncbi:lipocalin family protein [uncultured Rikenella sp.]|uniref:lipocalin family protein n=1 Tax=uncultured Rikenella sp. TaxID=368003 RepID=UPI00272B7427|nr:lipocalin family protein [uncultured Rikenella sp.]